MIYINVILRLQMKTLNRLHNPLLYIKESSFLDVLFKKELKEKETSPFWIMVQKEISDHIHSWRFIVLLALIVFTCFGSLYTSIGNLQEALNNLKDPNHSFAFLKLLTVTDHTLPPFHVFIGFLGPLLGISLGFDAVNSEMNNGSLVRIMAQPIHRDYLINAKFTAAIITISTLFISLSLLFVGSGILITGLTPSPEEFLRILAFTALSILYVSFWLNLSIIFSIKFKQAATSALTSIAVWLFFTIFYQILVNIVAKVLMPSHVSNPLQLESYKRVIMGFMGIVPSQLFSDATTTLLVPSVRSLGSLSMSQMYGALPSALPLRESLIVVWPQLTGLFAATIVCFAISYYLFMRREIRG